MNPYIDMEWYLCVKEQISNWVREYDWSNFIEESWYVIKRYKVNTTTGLFEEVEYF